MLRFRSLAVALSLVVLLDAPGFSQLGSNKLETIFFIEGEGENRNLGASVAGIGDINLDGYDDVLVGNPFAGGTGQAWIFFGGAEMDTIPDIILRGENEGDFFGSRVAGGADFNGDGDPDFVVGATGYPERRARGKLYVYYGGALLDTIPDAMIVGEEIYHPFPLRIAFGRADPDSLDDLLVSGSKSDGRGRAYLFSGKSLSDGHVSWTKTGTIDQYLGSDLAVADLDGNGLGDVVIQSSPYLRDENRWLTKIEVYFNHGVIDSIPTFTLVDSSWGDASSDETVVVQDVNLDGVLDLIWRLGVRHNVYYGSATFDTIPDAYLLSWPYAGIVKMAAAGDVNGDNWPDIFAGAPHLLFSSGSVGLYLGGENINSEVDWTTGGSGHFGYSIDGAGDVNGDGYDDLIVGSLTLMGVPRLDKGWVWIFAGNGDLVDRLPTTVERRREEPSTTKAELLQNYPNPFNDATTITFRVPPGSPRHVKLSVYDVRGRMVKTLLSGTLTPGVFTTRWQGTNTHDQMVGSGVYFCRLEVGTIKKTIKLLVLR